MSMVELNATPSIGSILGSQGSRHFLDSINEELSAGSSGVYFGSAADRYKDHYQSFVDKVVTPIIKTAKTIKNTLKHVVEKDKIISINNIETLEAGIPVTMELPIIMYEPIKNLLKEESIYGFGYEYENIKDTEDVYGRLISNGFVQLNGPDADEYIVSEWKSTDPVVTFEELDNIEETRMFIDTFLEEHEGVDFTSYPDRIGKIK